MRSFTGSYSQNDTAIKHSLTLSQLATLYSTLYAKGMTLGWRIIAAFIAFTLWAFPESPLSKPLSSAERTVCKSIRHCVDIVSRHDPKSYDYEILSQEFVKFGDKGRHTLLKMMMSENTEKSERAQKLLIHPNFRFAPQEQKLIAQYWPKGDVHSLRIIMLRLYSPLMRRTVLETATHPDENIRMLSLDVLKSGEAALSKSKTSQGTFQPTPDQFPQLIKSIRENPSPELIRFLSKYPIEKTRATLIKSLGSDLPANVITAYAALKTTEPNTAPGILLSHIKASQSPRNLLALMALLQAGLPTDQTTRLKTALEPKLPLIWEYLKRHPMENKQEFLDIITQFDRSSPLDRIYVDALADPGNWRVSALAAHIIGLYKIESTLPLLSNFIKTHPIREMRFEALKAHDKIKGEKTSLAEQIAQINAQFPACEISSDDIRKSAKRMPYFEGVSFKTGTPASRGHLTSATPTSSGWLAGYARKNQHMSSPHISEQMGALSYYDNATGSPKVLMQSPVQFVTPKSVPPLGQSTKAFWAFVSDPDTPEDDGKLLSLSETKQGEFDITLHAELPARAIAFKREPDQSLLITFSDKDMSPFENAAHPPLRLWSNGRTSSACAPRTGGQNEATR